MNRLGIKHAYDKLWIGILIGTIVPFVMYAILLSISDALASSEIGSENGLVYGLRTRTLALIALLSNVIPMQIFYKNIGMMPCEVWFFRLWCIPEFGFIYLGMNYWVCLEIKTIHHCS